MIKSNGFYQGNLLQEYKIKLAPKGKTFLSVKTFLPGKKV